MEIFSKWTARKYFQNGHQPNFFKMENKEIFSKWTPRKYFQNGHQGNIFKFDTK